MYNITIIDIVNFFIAFIGLILSIYNTIILRHADKRPHILLKSVYFDPSDFECYAGETLSGYKNIKEITDYERYINNDKIIEKFYSKGKNYLLVNTLNIKNRGKTNIRDIRLILAPYQFDYENTGNFINTFILRKTIFQLSNGYKATRRQIDYEYTPSKNENKINIKVAYLCKVGDELSVIYERLINLKEKFDYQENSAIAKNIINFKKEIYVINARTNANDKYKIKIVLKMTEKGLKIYNRT